MQTAAWIIAAAAAFVMALGLYVRLAPSDPARWHVDPTTMKPPEHKGHILFRTGGASDAAPRFEMTPAAALAAFDARARAAPRVTVLAGSVESGWITYVARSRIWGFPDYISVRALPDRDGSRLAIFSRQRFGRRDMGVNAARIRGWLSDLPVAP